MNLFEELNKVLLEDKNRQFIASVEAFTAFNHPQVFYTYAPPSKSGRRAYLDAQTAYGKEYVEDLLKQHFDAKPINRVDVIKLPMPAMIRKGWDKELEERFAEAIDELRKHYQGGTLEKLGEIEHGNLKSQWQNTPLTRAEFNAIATFRNNTAYFIGSLGKGVEPQLTRTSLDPNRIAAKYIQQYLSDYAQYLAGNAEEPIESTEGSIESIDDLNYYLQIVQDDDEKWDGMFYYVDHKMRDEHVEYDGDLEQFVHNVINNIEKYAFKDEEVYFGGEGRPSSLVQAKNVLAIEPTADGPTRRNLTDLPRHPNDQRPTVANSAEEAVKNKQEDDAYYPQHSWIVITGYERSGSTGIKPERRSKAGRWVGTCPYCNGEKHVGIDNSMNCPECDAGYEKGPLGYDWAWYWASESQYQAHPEYTGETESLTPFDKVFRAVWDALKVGAYGHGWEPEAYDGFAREEPGEDDDPELQGAGRLRKQDSYPVPQRYPFGARERPKHAANTPLFTAVIKCNEPMGATDRDLWRADYKSGKGEGTFQGLTKAIGEFLEESGLGYEIDPINNMFEPEDETAGTVQSEPLGSAYAIHVWDYVVEPGHLYRTATDQSLEREYMDPNQAPFEQLQQAVKVWEIAKHLDAIGKHQPRLWAALGLSDNANLDAMPEVKDSFLDHVLAVIQNLKSEKGDRFEDQSRIVKELQDVVKQHQKYNYSSNVMSHHVEQLFRVKTALDTMFYSKILGIPPSWNEDILCEECQGLGEIGGEKCAACDGSGSQSITRQQGETGLWKREGLWRRAKRIEEIWEKLPQPRYKNNQPHNALRMGLGLYWDVPNEYQNFLEEKIKELQEEDEARKDPYPEKIMAQLRLKGSDDDRYSNEWRPIRYFETAANDLRHIITSVRDPRTDDDLTKDELGELGTYYHEIVAIIEKAQKRLLDPAFKKRIRRSQKELEKWEKYGKPEEMIKDRSKNISDKLVEVTFDRHIGRLDDEKCFADKDCLEALIFIEIQKLVTERGSIGGIDAKHLWLRQNRYKSYLIVKDEIEQWVVQNASIPANYTLEKLVHPGTELPVDVLSRIYKELHRFNTDESFEAEEERRALVTRAFQPQGKNN